MSMEIKNLHSHICSECLRPHCGCYLNPCPWKFEHGNSYVCGFCKIGVAGPKPKQDALEAAR